MNIKKKKKNIDEEMKKTWLFEPLNITTQYNHSILINTILLTSLPKKPSPHLETKPGNIPQ